MQDIELGFHRKARVWIYDKPQILYPAIETVSLDIERSLSRNSQKEKTGALEILIPVGGRFFYGLLGAEFIPNDSGNFTVEVLISTDQERIYKQSIASKLDQIRVGLPSEYSQSVINGITEPLNKETLRKLGSGLLRFNQGAYSNVGSSNKIFRHIATTVVQLLMVQRGSNDQEVTKIVKDYSSV